MKKVLCVCAACLMMAALTTSCNKRCECKTYIAGSVTTTEIELDKDHYKKCSDLDIPTTEVNGTIMTGVKCRSLLF